MLSTHQISKLEEAFLHDASPEEAAALAKVTFYDLTQYIATHDEWYLKCIQSAHVPIVQAKINLGQAVLNNDLEASRYILERKRPREWSPKAQLNIVDERPMVILPSQATKEPIDIIATQHETPSLITE